MEKRRVRLEINGVVCGLITQESDAYMRSLAEEVGDVMQEILKSSPYITREAAALTVALNYCDDAKKNGQKRQQLQDRVDELEVEAEVWHEERADMIQNGPNPETRARMENLERRNSVLQEIAGEVDELRRKVKSLEKEKAALEEQTGSPTQLEPLRREVEQLREENKRMRQGQGASPENEELLAELEKLAAANAALQREAEEQAALAKKAEQERQTSVAAAKRAVEEAKKMVDRARAEAAAAKGELPPQGEEQKAPAQERPDEEQPAAHRRKNPLRHEDEYEQEGFVSFFEKK